MGENAEPSQESDALRSGQSIRGLGTGQMVSMWRELATLKCPLLFCAGEEDQKYCQIGEEIMKRVPGGEFAVIPAAGHAAHLEAMADSAATIEDWHRRI